MADLIRTNTTYKLVPPLSLSTFSLFTHNMHTDSMHMYISSMHSISISLVILVYIYKIIIEIIGNVSQYVCLFKHGIQDIFRTGIASNYNI